MPDVYRKTGFRVKLRAEKFVESVNVVRPHQVWDGSIACGSVAGYCQCRLFGCQYCCGSWSVRSIIQWFRGSIFVIQWKRRSRPCFL